MVLTGYDFANEERIGNLGGTLWNDFNGDGIRTTGSGGAFTDVALSGWTVFLDENHNGMADPTEPSQTTDINGQYTFVGLPEGAVTVAEVVPSGWEVAPGFSASVNASIATGLTTTVDFANLQPVPSTINGAIYNDMNADGSRATNPTTGAFTEPGLAGWQVFVDINNDGLLTAGEPTATSDAAGNYSLTGVPHGTRKIVEVANPNFIKTAPASGQYTINVLNGATIGGYDFGNQERSDATIRGTVYADSDHDGVRDAGERGLSGVTVFLDLNDDGVLDAGEPSLVTSVDLYYTPGTDEAGTYTFAHLAGGTYKLREIVPVELSGTPVSEAAQSVTIGGAEAKTVDAGNVFRPNEIHGVKFDDANGNHVRDAGEAGIGGTTIYIDLDRDNVLDAGEPSTVTAADGSYAFTNLTADAYVVRELESAGFEQTFPTTTDGTLWPTGTSNLASGNVTPTSITASLAAGEKLRQTVSLTLPSSGGVTNLADVFLLFDDTGSFTSNSPIVRAAFPQIISTLTTSLPGIDFGFGVARFEEYGSFAGEYATGRPFILNSPIVASSTPGFSTAIQAALDRTTPGYGGDGPETDIEALFQTVTGLGFDGNNNGTFSDSGAAGLVSTQLTPGNSGDVPSFASYTADPAGSGLPAAGSLGGAGFRAGALPIILVATDIGFAYQPKGETSIVGLNGVTIAVADIAHTTRTTTPFNYGAGIQETITGLNALGALVIGLGTNADLGTDPRADLSAIARLTGAINNSADTIANGTANPIAPGDPFYFQISSGFGASVANSVVSAIQNAVTNVAVNMTVKASDPRVLITNFTGTLAGIGAGQTATFDVEFTGDGRPHRFDLQFIREGTNVVLGSIPVVLGTPVPGSGYEFDDLLEGEIELESNFGSRSLSGLPTNVAPSFLSGTNQTVLEDAGAQTVTIWATSISAGPASESAQTVDFVVSNDNTSLFSVAPAIAADGTLTYTPAANANGSATITVSLHDNGGTASGGTDTSASQTFTITVSAVNDAPTASDGSLTTDEDTTTTGTLSAADIDSAALTVSLFDTTNAHGTVTITDAATGAFSYTPDANFNGSASFTFSASDGSLVSNISTVTIAVNAVNDAPVAIDDSLTTNEDTATTGTLAAADIDSATLAFSLVSTTNAHGSVTITNNATGAFSYSPDANFNGSASFTFLANDGSLVSNIGTVTITVNALNDAPTANDGSLTTNEDAATTGTLSASDIDSAALAFSLVNTTNAHGSVTITNNAIGAFRYTPDADFNGSASFTFLANDGTLVSNIGTVTITVNALNDAPIASDGSLTTDEDIATTGMLSASDIDSPTLTFSLGSVANAHGLVKITDPATGAFSYTPETNYNGSASFTFSASDGSLVSNISTMTIAVNAVNDAPTANDGSLTTNEETATTGTLSATDIDSAALTFSLGSTTNAHGSVTVTDAATGAFIYTPDANFDGSASFTFSASDGSLVSNIGTVTITVNGVNDAPIASDSSLTTDEDTAKTGMLSAADIDSATLSFNLVSTSNAHGSVTITNNTTGAFSYTPDANFSGSASFTFLANDSSLVSNIGTVTMTINAVNDAPTANDGSLTTNEDTAKTGTLSATDIDSATLTFSLVSTMNAHGTVTITDATTGAFSYTPDANFNGLGNFTFSASDGSLISNNGTVTITVSGVNDAPVASDGSLTTNEDTATTGTLLASDIDSAALAFSLVSTTNAHGIVTITNTATGAFSYTPDEDFSGSASFTFLASDGTLDSNIGTVTITVNAVSDIVVASDGSLTTNEDTATTGTLVASDLDGSVLAYSLFSTTNAHGSVTITNNTTGAFSYTPDANFSGSASFTFLANDNTVVSNIGTVSITVNAVNDAPSFTEGADQSGSLSGVAQTVSQWATGISAGPANEAGQLVNFLVSTNNDALFSVLPAISADGTLTYTLANNTAGSATVSVRLHDNGGIADGGVDTSALQTFVISTVNRAPSFVKGANQSVLEDAGAKTIVGWATGISAGLSELAQVVDFFVTTNNNGLFSQLPAISATGTLMYTTAPNANGSATVTVRAHDNGGTTSGGVDTSAPQTFTITVQAVNDLPTISAIADVVTDEDTPTGPIVLTIGDVETAANSLVVSVSSTNTSLIPSANVNLGGSGANRTVSVIPAANRSGSSTITLSVRDGNRAVTTESFVVTVNPINDSPTITAIANQTIDEDKSTNVLNFSVSDIDNLAGSLVVTATSSNTDLVSTGNIVLTGSGANRSVKMTPLPNHFGSTTITLTVTDPGGASSSKSFQLTVRPVNDAPIVTAASFSVPEYTTNGAIVGTVSAADPDPGDTVTAFAITAGNVGNAFAIDSTGKLTVSDATKIDFEAKSSYMLTVKATDNHGASGLGTVTVNIANMTFNPVVTLADTANSVLVLRVGTNLVVRSGTADLMTPVRLEDVGTLTIVGGSAADSVVIDSSLNSSGTGSANRFSRIIAFQGNAGDDRLDAHNVNAPIAVNFSGGDGNDIGIGGGGNDTLGGDDGRDVLIGGAGNDLINGGSGEEIVIGGTSTLSGNTAALNAVMLEWGDTSKAYADRIRHLTSGGAGSANGSTRLNSSTVKNDSRPDSVNGGSDLDWFFQSAADVLDAINGETKTLI